jgi:hypothetical protein
MEAPLSGRSYRHAPDRRCLRVPIFGIRRHKPPDEPETWCDGLPTTSAAAIPPRSVWDAVLDKLWFLGSLVSLGPATLACVFLAGYGLICIASAGPLALLQFFLLPIAFVAVPLGIMIAIVRPKCSVLELDDNGIHLLGAGASSARFVPYEDLLSVQTYLDEGVRGDSRRGAIFGVEGGQSITLELGENTAKVVEAICHHTNVVARHSRCTWVC